MVGPVHHARDNSVEIQLRLTCRWLGCRIKFVFAFMSMHGSMWEQPVLIRGMFYGRPGRTPLHCAASCNSVHLCKMLVESGAAIFATTISDVETAADKCEEMEEGYTQCSQFLYGRSMWTCDGSARKHEGVFTLLKESGWLWCYQTVSPSLLGVQEKLGVMNKGLVYALWDYTAQHPDELSFSEGDVLAVLRRSDDMETEWWWARLNDHEGYVPRNLLGVRTHKTLGQTNRNLFTCIYFNWAYCAIFTTKF